MQSEEQEKAALAMMPSAPYGAPLFQRPNLTALLNNLEHAVAPDPPVEAGRAGGHGSSAAARHTRRALARDRHFG